MRLWPDPIGQPPIEQWVKPSDRVLLVSDDNTRLTPADRMIPPLLARLNAAGVPDRNIACIMALGTHRYMTDDEMMAKVGQGVWRRIRVFNHAWREAENLVELGTSSAGTPLQVNRAVVEADVVIGLGAIVPHHIPGYSGSSKIIQPGVCGPKTTAETHMLSCEGGGDSLLGIEDNPVRRDMDDMADRVGMQHHLQRRDGQRRPGHRHLLRGDARRLPEGGCRPRGRSTASNTAKHPTSWLPTRTPATWISGNPTNPSTRPSAWSNPAGPSWSARRRRRE